MSLLFRYPVLGAGVDSFGLAYSPLRTPESWALEWNIWFARAHNEPLQLLATQGLLGGLAALVTLSGLLVSAGRAWNRVEEDDRVLLASVLLGMACLVPQCLFGMLQITPAVLMITFAAAVSVAAREPAVAAASEPPSRHVLVLSQITAALAPMVLLLNRAAWSASGLAALATIAAFVAPLAITLLIARFAGPTPPERARPSSKPSASRPLALMAAVLVLSTPLLFRPVAANIASAAGSRAVASDAASGLAHLERAVTLDPSSAAHWIGLGSGRYVPRSRSPRLPRTCDRELKSPSSSPSRFRPSTGSIGCTCAAL